MTVAELIEKLKEMPQDAEVFLPYHEDVVNVVVYCSNEVELTNTTI